MQRDGSGAVMERVASGFGLLEAARWYAPLGLVFSDMTRGGVYTLRDGEEPEVLIPHRKGIGGMVSHEDGGMVVAGRNVAHKRREDGTTTVLLESAADETFFNDMTADSRGRLYVGSVAGDPLAADHAPSAGRLYRIDLDGTTTVLADDVLLSNGMAVTPDDRTLYHADSDRHVIWAYDLSAADPPTRRVHVDTSGCKGVPDGVALDADGALWVAMAGGGSVIGWDKDGVKLTEIEMPQSVVTSVAFGGTEFQSLFVTTGPSEDEHDDVGGAVYVMSAPVQGLPCSTARVDMVGVDAP